jgi:hypothetical protein
MSIKMGRRRRMFIEPIEVKVVTSKGVEGQNSVSRNF